MRDRSDESSVESARRAVESALESLLENELHGVPDAISDPVRYAVLSPGKRIRPVLVIAAYRAAGGTHPAIAELACSVELVHAYSLIHDDLPCMDDDVLRRGKATHHVRFGVPAAVLAGAALMPLAVKAIVSGAARMALAPDRTERLVAVLTSASGAAGMVGGQLLDLQAEGRRVTRAELEAIHSGKTARLIAASVVLGGLAAGAEEDTLVRLRRFGHSLGLAFQAVDDILDMRGTPSELGKQSGRDIALGKATYPSLFGLEEAETISRSLAATAIEELTFLENQAHLREIARYVIDRSH